MFDIIFTFSVINFPIVAAAISLSDDLFLKFIIAHSPASAAVLRALKLQNIPPLASVAKFIQSHCIISSAVGQSGLAPLYKLFPP